MAQKTAVEHCQEEDVGRQRSVAWQRPCTKTCFPSGWLRDDTEGEAEEVEEMRKDQRRRH